VERALSHNETIEKASAKVIPSFGLPAIGPFIHRETRLLGMLYILLVFPSEIWKRKGLLDVVVERARADRDLKPENLELVSTSKIRSLRNAVSHAKIEFRNGSVCFEDSRGGASPHFTLEISIANIINVILVMGRAFHECERINENIEKAGRIHS
jgi:hypothetical protein